MRRLLLAAIALLPLGLSPARADEVGDAIAEAARAWRAGDGNAARTALEEAMQLLAQRNASGMGAALPAPLPGWTAEAAESNTAALGVFGGTQASRTYTNAQGQTVRIQVTADNPIIAQLAMVMTNPAMAGAMGRLIRIGGQRAIQTNSNEIQMLVDNRILVAVEGDAPVEAKLAYARAIDLGRLAGK
jgi:hypothetical protein